jgi:hypothetical protein
MRRKMLRIIGAVFIIAALIGLVPGMANGWLSSSVSYNAFLLVFGLMSLGSADLGADFTLWFGLSLMLIMIIIGVSGIITRFTGNAAAVPFGTIIVNLVALILSVRVVYLSFKKQ